jgi:hypothetical protein
MLSRYHPLMLQLGWTTTRRTNTLPVAAMVVLVVLAMVAMVTIVAMVAMVAMVTLLILRSAAHTATIITAAHTATIITAAHTAITTRSTADMTLVGTV